MPNKIIADFLRQDFTDSTALTVYNNPANAGLFSSPSDVPVYLYQSLKTIFSGVSSVLSDYQKQIVTFYGRGATNAKGDIAVIALQSESAFGSGPGFHSDEPGAEKAKVGIYLRLQTPIQSADYERIRNAELRIRFIIDSTINSVVRQDSDNLPVSPGIDLTIFDNYFKCFWEGFDAPPNESELLTMYRVEYVRVFAQ